MMSGSRSTEPVQLAFASSRELQRASEISSDWNDFDIWDHQPPQRRDRVRIAIDGVEATSGLKPSRQRMGERAVAGSQIGPILGMRWNCRKQCFSLIDSHRA